VAFPAHLNELLVAKEVPGPSFWVVRSRGWWRWPEKDQRDQGVFHHQCPEHNLGWGQHH